MRNVILLILVLASSAYAQRRGGDKPVGDAASVLYRETFDAGAGGFQATGYGSAKFLAKSDPTVSESARVEGFDVSVTSPGAMGSGAALRIAGAGAQFATAEHYFDFPADQATIVFLFYAHGLDTDEGLMVQGWAQKAGRNLHAYTPVRQQDRWHMARISAPSMVGFGGGAVEAGETLANLMFVAKFNPSVRDAYLLVDQIVIFKGDDGSPPTAAPSNIKTRLSSDGAVVLSWDPAADDTGVYLYEVHRGAEAGFEPDRKTRLDTVSATTFTDTTAPDDALCVYRVIAVDTGGYRAASDAVTTKTPARAATTSGAPIEF